jgi:hypothetical protein
MQGELAAVEDGDHLVALPGLDSYSVVNNGDLNIKKAPPNESDFSWAFAANRATQMN